VPDYVFRERRLGFSCVGSKTGGGKEAGFRLAGSTPLPLMEGSEGQIKTGGVSLERVPCQQLERQRGMIQEAGR